MITVRSVDGMLEAVDGHVRLRVTLDVLGHAEVEDFNTGKTYTVHEVAGRMVMLDEDGQRAIARARG